MFCVTVLDGLTEPEYSRYPAPDDAVPIPKWVMTSDDAVQVGKTMAEKLAAKAGDAVEKAQPPAICVRSTETRA